VRDEDADGDALNGGQSDDPRSTADGDESDAGPASDAGGGPEDVDRSSRGEAWSSLPSGAGVGGDPDGTRDPDAIPDTGSPSGVAPPDGVDPDAPLAGGALPGVDLEAGVGGDPTADVDSAPDVPGDVDVDVEEAIGTVRTRYEFLVTLREEPLDKAALTASVSVSRSTVNRAVRRLEELGFVERVEGGWRTTLAGRVALRAFARFRDRMAGIVRGRPILAYVPADAESTPTFAPPPATFADGEVSVIGEDLTVAEAGRRVAATLEEADRWSGLAKRINPDVIETVHDRIVEGDAAATVVLDPGTLESLLAEWRDRLAAMVATGRLALHAGEDLPFGLYVVETGETARVCLLAYDDLGRPRGIVRSAAPAAVAWARAVVADRLEAADRVDPTN
jgi:predicted transcriptional regulator